MFTEEETVQWRRYQRFGWLVAIGALAVLVLLFALLVTLATACVAQPVITTHRQPDQSCWPHPIARLLKGD